MNAGERAALRNLLQQRYPWVDDAELGPRNVEAGECDACGVEPRLVLTCGPARGQYLGRRCALEEGAQAWCDGHAEDARRALMWLAELPGEADTVARLWWVATGEIVLDPALVVASRQRLGLPG